MTCPSTKQPAIEQRATTCWSSTNRWKTHRFRCTEHGSVLPAAILANPSFHTEPSVSVYRFSRNRIGIHRLGPLPGHEHNARYKPCHDPFSHEKQIAAKIYGGRRKKSGLMPAFRIVELPFREPVSGGRTGRKIRCLCQVPIRYPAVRHAATARAGQWKAPDRFH